MKTKIINKLLFFAVLILASCTSTKDIKDVYVTKENISSPESGTIEPAPILYTPTEDAVSNFSYEYGIMLMEDLQERKAPFNLGYLLRGMYDVERNPHAPFLISYDHFIDVINDFEEEEEKGSLPFPINSERIENTSALSVLTPPLTLTGAYSYVLGFTILRDIYDSKLEYDLIYLMAGMEDALFDDIKTIEASYDDPLLAYVVHMAESDRENQKKTEAGNIRKAENFLNRNRKRKSVKELENGVQLILLEKDEKTGEKPSQYCTVLIDFNEYVLNYESGEPEYRNIGRNEEIRVMTLAPGLQSAICAMHTGEAVRAYIPPSLTGLEEGDGDMVEPGSVLVYDIALKEIL